MNKHYDVIVVGSGGGVKIALPAATMGRRVAFVDERDPGGTCLNRGCIPSKMLIYPTELADRMRNCAKLNIELPAPPGLCFDRLVARTTETVRKVSTDLGERFRSHPNIDFYHEHAEFVANHRLRVDSTEMTGDLIFLATGSRPLVPHLPGLAGTPFMTSEEALRRLDLPRKLVVIGAGYIAVELGGAFAAAGSDVHFIVRSRLLRREDEEIAREFRRAFARRHSLHEGFRPESVSFADGEFSVTCRNQAGEALVVTGDALLVATGVKPQSDRLGLEHTNIAVDDHGFIRVDDRLQTSVPGVYALGDVVGTHLFRHTVNYEGEYLVSQLFHGQPPAPLDYGPVPHAVFASPEVAGVGLREQDARTRGLEYVVGKATYADSTPGMARLSDHGFAKIIVERATRRVLGAHIVGEEAATMVHLFIVLMKKAGTLDDLLDTIFIHPALPEVARDAARNARDVLGE